MALRETEFSVVFILARAVYRFDSSLVTNLTHNKSQPVGNHSDWCFWQDLYFSLQTSPEGVGLRTCRQGQRFTSD